jgi:hypothetical protein
MNDPINSISDMPSNPAIYAMYGGRGRGRHVAYVGLATSLRGRIEQHLVRRDSSVTTGTAAVCLIPENVTVVRWWHHPDFEKQEVLEAAELVAFDVLEPALRSRGNITDRAKVLYREPQFSATMRSFFTALPSGVLILPTLRDAMDRIASLEKRIEEIECQLEAVTKSRPAEGPAGR